jgi:hypothetical protein
MKGRKSSYVDDIPISDFVDLDLFEDDEDDEACENEDSKGCRTPVPSDFIPEILWADILPATSLLLSSVSFSALLSVALGKTPGQVVVHETHICSSAAWVRQ